MSGFLAGVARRFHRNPSLVRLERRVAAWAAELPAGALVLDAGAGDGRYRDRFARQRYESADFAQSKPSEEYAPLTYVCDLAAIPCEDARFDAILCTQVIAHLPHPDAALREFARVLKPGGRLLVSAPLFFAENEQPYDFWRFTQYGMRRLLADAGFEVDVLERVEGYYGTLSYQCGVAARVLPVAPSEYGGGVGGWLMVPVSAILKLVFAAACQLFTVMELRQKNDSVGQCINYLALGRKP